MTQLGKVGVLYGGRSAEREVSLMSGSGVLNALLSRGVDAHGFDTGVRTIAELIEEKFDRVFIALHGRFGEDGTLQGLLEQLGIAYTGSGVMASSIAMDKIMTKRVWRSSALPTAPFMTLDKSASDAQLIAAGEQLGYPFMLKAPHEGSSIGIRKVSHGNELRECFDYCIGFDTEILAEQFIGGRELTVPVIGAGSSARALPIVEIVAPGGEYNFHYKYNSDDTQYHCPAALDWLLTQEIQAYAVKAYNALGCTGWARVDFILRESDNAPFLLEINTSPGMTSHSLVPKSALESGVEYADLCLEILSAASLKTESLK